MFASVQVVIALTFFLLGFALGYIAGGRFQDSQDKNLRLKIALLIALVWAITVVAGIFVSGYTPSIFVHAIMGAIVGYLFGTENPIFDLGGKGK